MVRRSSCMGGHLTALINMAERQEWKGQRFETRDPRIVQSFKSKCKIVPVTLR